MNSLHQRVLNAVCSEHQFRVLKQFNDGQTGCSVFLVTNGCGLRIVKIGSSSRSIIEIGCNVDAFESLSSVDLGYITPTPIEYVRYGNTIVLIMEYGGIPLNHLLMISNNPVYILRNLTDWLLEVYSISLRKVAKSRQHVTQTCNLITRKVECHFSSHPIGANLVEIIKRMGYIQLLAGLKYSCFANTDMMPDDVSLLINENRFYFLDLHVPVFGMPLIDLGILLAGIETDQTIGGFGEQLIIAKLADKIVDLFEISHETGYIILQLGKTLHDVYAARYSCSAKRQEDLLARAQVSLRIINNMLNDN